eukprot:3448215-Rhodomonas_salina.2
MAVPGLQGATTDQNATGSIPSIVLRSQHALSCTDVPTAYPPPATHPPDGKEQPPTGELRYHLRPPYAVSGTDLSRMPVPARATEVTRLPQHKSGRYKAGTGKLRYLPTHAVRDVCTTDALERVPLLPYRPGRFLRARSGTNALYHGTAAVVPASLVNHVLAVPVTMRLVVPASVVSYALTCKIVPVLVLICGYGASRRQLSAAAARSM